MKTAIMTDTNSGISVQEGKENGIFVLPMPVMVDGVDYLEGETITHAELYDALVVDKEVMTAQPSLKDLLDFWDEILDSGYDELVYIPMSSGLSGSCHTATQFAEEYDGKVQVVDNHRISVTLANAVYDAKRLVNRGKNAKEIKEALEANAFNSSIYITVQDLKLLKKSGRVTPTAAMIATAMNIKPVLTIQGEKLDSYAKVRGMKAAETKMIEAAKTDLAERFKDYPQEKIRIGIAGTFTNEADADEWIKKVQEAFPDYKTDYAPLSCSIACHVSVDTAGIAVTVVEEK
ncbi:MAG: DegV family protein [Eubacterium sp.]|nr:DegV family protein [Eubacterium sp.]